MSETIRVEPRPDSYTNEWAAVRWTGPESFPAIKRLLRNTPWVVQLHLDDPKGPAAVLTQIHPTGVESWRLYEGEWMIKSPHDKIWTMSPSEFEANFK